MANFPRVVICTVFAAWLTLVAVAPQASESNPHDGIAPVEDLLGGLKARLKANPEDVGGWVLLAKSYRFLGDEKASDAAFEKATALGYVVKKEDQIAAQPRPAYVPIPRQRPLSPTMKAILAPDPMLLEMQRMAAGN